ncbi:hypothetical protein EZS27_016271 [termite gut metagenome]|uniref:Uncharacterized protein n=1 Tax=termite gut metagenome TaxID=433724 RepID=A0A5J4RP88_9ZZZZ
MTIDLETRMHLIGGRISPIKYQRLKAWTPQKDGELLIKAKECMTEVLGGVIPKNFVMNGTTEVGILMDKIPNS